MDLHQQDTYLYVVPTKYIHDACNNTTAGITDRRTNHPLNVRIRAGSNRVGADGLLFQAAPHHLFPSHYAHCSGDITTTRHPLVPNKQYMTGWRQPTERGGGACSLGRGDPNGRPSVIGTERNPPLWTDLCSSLAPSKWWSDHVYIRVHCLLPHLFPSPPFSFVKVFHNTFNCRARQEQAQATAVPARGVLTCLGPGNDPRGSQGGRERVARSGVITAVEWGPVLQRIRAMTGFLLSYLIYDQIAALWNFDIASEFRPVSR